MKETTLCYIEKDGAYLMLHRTKKKQDINAGKWIGVGGHLEMGETPDACLLREVKEETGLTLRAYAFRGIVDFYSDVASAERMYLYTATEFFGDLIPCNEGELAWIPKAEVSDLNLWEGDREFLPLLASDAPYFEMELRYAGDRLIEVKKIK